MEAQKLSVTTYLGKSEVDCLTSDKFPGIAVVHNFTEQADGWAVIHKESGLRLVGSLNKEEAIAIAKKLGNEPGIDWTLPPDALKKIVDVTKRLETYRMR